MRYEIGQANHLGNRDSNQDRFAVVESDEGVLLALADGMGGVAGGDLAAQTLVDIARERYLNSHRPVSRVGQFLANIIRETHDALLRLAADEDMGSIPGTTGVLCLIQDGRMDWVHVGDSRLYLFRGGLPVFRTTDHSYVEQLYQQGRISRSEQDSHPRRNHITQCIGCLPQTPDVEIGKGKVLREGDIVLLCSDGLWSAIDDAQMATLLQSGELDELVEQMATRAEQISYPHSDNISVVALRFLSATGASRVARPKPAPATASPPEEAPAAAQEKGPVDENKLKDAIEQIEAAIRTYGDELKR